MFSSDRVRTKLLAALDACDTGRLKTAISQLPTCLPQVEDPLEIASCLEEVRVAADVLIEACDSDTAFESAARTRTALVSAKVLPWIVSVLKNFAFEERVVARAALTLAHLGGGVELRGDIGASGAVDQLAILWKKHPSCVAIVQALISLCTGHIDNISRFMRRRGIATAVKFFNNPDTARKSQLVEHVMVLIGLCVICTPDNKREGSSLVPAILGALKQKQGRTQAELKKHVFIAIANMAECWTKEKAGYELGDVHGLVELIVETWISLPRSREIAYASSWALVALYRYDASVLSGIKERSQEMVAVHDRWRPNLKTVDFLASLTEELRPGMNRTKSSSQAIQLKSRKNEVVPDPGSDAGEHGGVEDDKSEDGKSEDGKSEDGKSEDGKSEDGKSEDDKSEDDKSEDNESEEDESEVEGDLTDREKSPASIDEGSIECQTIIVDSDSDDGQNPPSEPVEPGTEPKPKASPRALRSSPKEIEVIVLGSDSDDQGSFREEPRYSTRSQENRSAPKSVTATSRRKRARSAGEDIAHTEVSTKKHREELKHEDLHVRRSKRQRRPNPKYQSSPRRQGTRLLRRRKIEDGPPLVTYDFIVPPNHDFQDLDKFIVNSRRR
ncbi:Armadillo-like helical domain containing protein [Gracilaria domingensis]|nr:Armadillo-like helical domain containing protein [Gracilaria domingensis]